MKRTLSILLALILVICMLPAASFADGKGATKSSQKMNINGSAVSTDMEIYNIYNNNFFKLRDIAYLLNGTPSQFSVDWDAEANMIKIETGKPYVAVGGELSARGDMSKQAKKSNQAIMINGKTVDGLTVYNVANNNFFKLRDLGEALGFNVDWTAATNTIEIGTSDQPIKTVSRPQKNGFNDTTTVTLGNFTFTVPTYWKADINETYDYRSYAETGGKTAMLYIRSTYDENDTVSYEMASKENSNGAMSKAISTWFESCGTVTSKPFSKNGIQGFIYSVSGVIKGYDTFCECLTFPSIEDNRWVWVTLMQTDNTEYDYQADIEKVFNSVVKNVKKDSTAIRSDLKEFLDAYEAFVDEYCAFLQSYNVSDLSMLMKYNTLLQKYNDYMVKLDKLDTTDMNDAELLYYTQVTTRCAEKVLKASQNIK